MTNFPSAVHVAGSEAVTDKAHALLEEAAPGDRFAIGILESIPQDSDTTMIALAQAIRETGSRFPLSSRGTGSR